MNPQTADRERKAQEIFVRALEILPPDERDDYLAGACLNDPSLRERVEALLASNVEDDFLETPPPGLDQPSTDVEPPVTEGPGEVIGRYKLLEKLGDGGFGVVYMAEQREPVKRRVAVKIIKAGMDTREVVARFEAERQALAMMDHPNIAKVLDGGATQTGQPYFVMELVRGIKITEYCDQNRIALHERLGLFVTVCQAVQHAHQKGIIHRDLKPSNILVTLHDGVPVPMVIDFGIAKATQQELTERTVFTRFHQFIGTPAYMSPEQAELSGLDIDTRSDIYSLGVLLYELLTNQTPFDEKEILLEAGLDAMRRTIRETEPVRPSTRLSQILASRQSGGADQPAVRQPLSTIESDLDWIVMKCLEKDRTRRYETANGLVLDIRRHLANEPVMARPPSAAYRFQKLVKRNKGAFAAGVAVTVALVVGLSLAAWQAVERGRAARQARVEAAKSKRVSEFLAEMLKGVGPSVARGRDATIIREILDKTAAQLDQEMKDQPEVEAELRTTIGAIYTELGEFSKAEAMLRRALEIWKELHGEEHREVATALNNLASVHLARGDHARAEPLFREALAMYRKLEGHMNTDVAIALGNLVVVLIHQGVLDEAEARQREALAIWNKLEGGAGEHEASALHNFASIALQRGDPAGAEAMQRESLNLQRKLLGNEHPDLAISLNNLGVILQDQGRLEEAEALYRESLSMQRKMLGDEHPGMMHLSQYDLASVLREQGKYAEAEPLGRERLAHARRAFAGSPERLESFLLDVAEDCYRQGKHADAEPLYRELLANRRSHLAADDDDTLRAAASLARTLADWAWSNRADADSEARAREAERLLRNCLDVRSQQAADGAVDWRVADVKSRLGFALAAVAITEPTSDPEARLNALAQAEALLIEGNTGLQQSDTADKYKRDALLRLARLYETWNELAPGPEVAAKAAEWREQVAEFDRGIPAGNHPARAGP